MNAVDTNVLIYAHDPSDPRKQSIANALTKSLTDGALMWQVACEYINASRKLATFGYAFADAWNDIEDLSKVWTVLLPTWPCFARTKVLLASYSLSIWDAVLIATCIDRQVTRLYSEDFNAYTRIDTLEIVNPFAPAPAP